MLSVPSGSEGVEDALRDAQFLDILICIMEKHCDNAVIDEHGTLLLACLAMACSQSTTDVTTGGFAAVVKNAMDRSSHEQRRVSKVAAACVAVVMCVDGLDHHGAERALKMAPSMASHIVMALHQHMGNESFQSMTCEALAKIMVAASASTEPSKIMRLCTLSRDKGISGKFEAVSQQCGYTETFMLYNQKACSIRRCGRADQGLGLCFSSLESHSPTFGS